MSVLNSAMAVSSIGTVVSAAGWLEELNRLLAGIAGFWFYLDVPKKYIIKLAVSAASNLKLTISFKGYRGAFLRFCTRGFSKPLNQ